MIEKLFSSKARVEIMKLFLFNPNAKYYQRQIASLADQPIRAVQRELERLEKVGFIKKSMQGNRGYYEVNVEFSIYNELKSIFYKTVGIAEVLKTQFIKEKDVEIAFIYGSCARGPETLTSDIDLMVIGNIPSRKLSSVLSKPKRELGREINYAVFTAKEFRQKAKRNDHFISSVIDAKKIFLTGNKNELTKIIRSR